MTEKKMKKGLHYTMICSVLVFISSMLCCTTVEYNVLYEWYVWEEELPRDGRYTVMQ